MSYVEILSANTIIFIATYILENINALKHEVSKKITYDKAYYIGEQDFYIPKDANGKFH